MTHGFRKDDSGFALVAVVLLIAALVGLGVLITTYSVETNEDTTQQRIRENAFQAADAGVSDAIACLVKYNPQSYSTGISTCNSELNTPSDRTQLTDQGRNIGQYTADITDVSSAGSPEKEVIIDARGFGPQQGSGRLRSERRIEARVRLEPVGGFFDTIFAGGTGSSGSGSVEIKNNADVRGSVYARNLQLIKNNAKLGTVRTVGDFTTKTNGLYENIWSGGSVEVQQNTSVTLDVKACGDPTAGSGNITLGNGSSIGRDLHYNGTSSPSNPSSSVGGQVHTPPPNCVPPTDLGLPRFSYDPANYGTANYNPPQTVIEFRGTDAASRANGCLAQTRVEDQFDPDAGDVGLCETANFVIPTTRNPQLGSADGRLGGEHGTVVYVNDDACPGAGPTVLDQNWTIENHFTLITNCRLTVEGNLSYANDFVTESQVILISEADTGDRDLLVDGTLNVNASANLLLYTTGKFEARNHLRVGAGSVYASSVEVKNNVDIGASHSLEDTPPPGFLFDEASRFLGVIIEWRELGT